jgi:hypothetical protein
MLFALPLGIAAVALVLLIVGGYVHPDDFLVGWP